MAVVSWSSSPFQQAWTNALREYASLLPPEERVNLEDSKWLEITNLDDLVHSLGRQHDDFNAETTRGSNFTGCLKGLGQGLSVLMNMFGGAASAAFPPCSQVFGAVSVLINAGRQTSGAFDALGGLFSKLGGFVERLQPLSANQMEPALEKVVVALLVSLLKICALATRKTYHDPDDDDSGKRFARLSRFKRSSKSKVMEYLTQLATGTDTEINGALAELEALVDAETRMTVALTKRDTSDIKREVEAVSVDIRGMNLTIRTATYEIQRDTQGIKLQMIEVGETLARIEGTMATKADVTKQYAQNAETLKSINEVKAMLRASGGKSNLSKRPPNSAATKAKKQAELLKNRLDPPAANQNLFDKIKDERIKGTGDWILQEPLVKRWLDHELPLLFVSGGKGLGKTFSASRIVEELQINFENSAANQKTPFAYFFCKKNLSELTSVTRMLRALAYQIAVEDKIYMNYLDSTSRAERLGNNDIELHWKTLFHEFFEDSSSSATIVIDGVDECDNDEFTEFLDAVAKLSIAEGSWRLPNLHLILVINDTSVTSLTEKLGEGHSILTLDKSSNEKDIEALLEVKLKNDNWAKGLVSKPLLDEVHDALLEHCHGNFLWTSFVLEEITSLSREDAIRSLLADLPKDVSSAMLLVLNRVTRRLDAHGLEDLNDLIAYVACAHRYLSISHLDALLTIRSPSGSRVINLKELLEKDYCSLFVLSEDDKASDESVAERVRQRLKEEEANVAIGDSASVVGNPVDADVAYDGTQLGTETKAKPDGEDKKVDEFEAKLQPLRQITVRLANDVVEQYNANAADIARNGAGLSTNTSSALDLSMPRMRAKVLRRCLQAMCDIERSDSEAADRARQYCALYLPEHISDVDVNEVDTDSKIAIVRFLLRIFREDKVIEKWIDKSASYMVDDFLNSEETIKKITEILQWPGLEEHISSTDREWIEEVAKAPIKTLFFDVACGHARRWLVNEWNEDEYLANYVFLNAYVAKANGEASDNDYTVGNSSADRIIEVARWAKFDEKKRWLRRVGFVLEEAGHYVRANELFKQAIDLNRDNPKGWQAIGRAYWSYAASFDTDVEAVPYIVEGTPYLETAVELYKKRMTAEDSSPEKKVKARQRYLQAIRTLATYYRYAKEVEKSKAAFEELLDKWEAEKSENDWNQRIGVNFYVEGLHNAARHEEAMKVLERAVAHPRSEDGSFWTIYHHWVTDADVLIKIAYKAKRPDVLDSFWQHAKQALARVGEEGETGAARCCQAFALIRLQPERSAEAMNLLKIAMNDEELANPANGFSNILSAAERGLAREYLRQAIEARETDRWADVGKNVHELYQLARVQDGNKSVSFKTTEAALILAVWNRLNSRTEHARQITKPSLEQGIEMLYDSDAENDSWAVSQLCDTLLAAGDFERARAANGLLGSLAVFGNEIGLVDFSSTETTSEADDEDDDEDEAADGVPDGEVPADGTPADSLSSPTAETNGDQKPNINGDGEHEKVAARELVEPRLEQVSEHSATATDQKPSQPANSLGSAAQEHSETNGIDTADKAASPVAEIPNEQNTPSTVQPDTGNGLALESGSQVMDGNEISQPVEKDDKDASFWYSCDGICFKAISRYDTWYRCSYCIADFCESCCGLIKEGNLSGYNICGRNHEFVSIPPVERLPEQKLKVGGELITITEWLDGLADDWGIPRRHPKETNPDEEKT